MSRYYDDKQESLARLFGARSVEVQDEAIVVDGRRLPTVEDVILTGRPEEWPSAARRALAGRGDPAVSGEAREDFAEDVQFTFGAEWERYAEVLPEHEDEFRRYFDLVDLEALSDSSVLDLGCGMGRWSFHVAPHCREIVLVDFSDAIFVARRNLAAHPHALFVQGDLTRLPFADDCADLAFCLGVLHHVPADCLELTRELGRLAPRLLVFLYYALDNRPWHYRLLLGLVTMVRRVLCRIRSERLREWISWAGARLVYRPLVALGRLLERLAGKGSLVPLYDFYRDRSLERIEQDVYDRFFTRIEQRVSREQIRALSDRFDEIRISDDLPYWHFLCLRGEGAAD